MASKPGIIVTVHGIRTYGAWSGRLAAMLRESAPAQTVTAYAYGYFSALAFAIPFLRWIEVRRFRQHLLRLCARNRDADVCIIAHSFGTYVVAHALRGMPVAQRPPIARLILCGSVLKPTFDCTALLDGGVRTIVNDCCTDDAILLLAQCCIVGTGMAGRVGFYGLDDGRLTNRFHTGGHSGYFDDGFMRAWWSAILGDVLAAPARSDRVHTPTLLDGVKHVLTGNLDPVKIAAYALLLGWPVYSSIQAINLVTRARQDFLAGGEEVAFSTLLRHSQFPLETEPDSPLKDINLKSANYTVGYTDALNREKGPALFVRTYNSRATARGLFGTGWGSSLETRLTRDERGVVVQMHLTGEAIHFQERAGGGWIADRYMLRATRDGYVMTAGDGRTSVFGRNGRLLEERVPGAVPLRLVWRNDRLVALRDFATFHYDGANELSEIRLADGRKATYRIVNRQLVEATDAAGTTYRHDYDKDWNMTGIRYADGTRRTIGYDHNSWVTYARYPNGYELKIGYGAMVKSQTGSWTESAITVDLTRAGQPVLAKHFVLFETFPQSRLFKTVEIIGDARIETDYDPALELPVQIRALGKVVNLEYDQYGRLVKQRGKEIVGIRYDERGRIAGWEHRDQGWNLTDDIAFQYGPSGELARIVHQRDTMELTAADAGLEIVHRAHRVRIAADTVLLDDHPVATRAQAAAAGVVIAEALRTSARPVELLRFYRPCGCNAFAETVLSNERKDLLEQAQATLLAIR